MKSKIHDLPEKKRLEHLFEYFDGCLFNRVSRGRGGKSGSRAGGYGRSGSGVARRTVQIDQTRYMEHRVIAAMFGMDTSNMIDHIDGDPLNNRIENLRPSDCSKNLRNMCCRNELGFSGVHFDKSRNKWLAYASPKTGFVNLGRHSTLIDAVAARLSYNRENGYTERHGR